MKAKLVILGVEVSVVADTANKANKLNVDHLVHDRQVRKSVDSGH